MTSSAFSPISTSAPWPAPGKKRKLKNKDLRGWVSANLITSAETRATVYRDEQTGKTEGLPNAAAKILEEEHVLREEPRHGLIWYELAHDLLIGPIRESNRQWFDSRRKRFMAIILGFSYIASTVLFLVGSNYFQDRSQEREFKDATEEFAVGRNYLLDNRPADAVASLQSARDKVAKLNEVQTLASVRMFLGEALYLGGKLDDAQVELATAEKALNDLNSRDDLARVKVDLAVVQASVGRWAVVPTLVQEAKQISLLKTLERLDWGIGTIRQRHYPFLDRLRLQRRDLLKEAAALASPPSELKQYICYHNLYVIGFSERTSKAPAKLEDIKKVYPLAEIGAPGKLNPQYVPIIVDFFLTCEEAGNVLNQVQKDYKSHPFVGGWDTSCPLPCKGLPFRIGDWSGARHQTAQSP